VGELGSGITSVVHGDLKNRAVVVFFSGTLAQKLSDIGFFVLLWLISLYFVTTISQLIHPSVFFSLDKKTSMIERVSKDQALPNLFHTEV
jgi:hypothetical protein